MTIPKMKPDPKRKDLGEAMYGSPDPSKPRPKPEEPEKDSKEEDKK